MDFHLANICVALGFMVAAFWFNKYVGYVKIEGPYVAQVFVILAISSVFNWSGAVLVVLFISWFVFRVVKELFSSPAAEEKDEE